MNSEKNINDILNRLEYFNVPYEALNYNHNGDPIHLRVDGDLDIWTSNGTFSIAEGKAVKGKLGMLFAEIERRGNKGSYTTDTGSESEVVASLKRQLSVALLEASKLKDEIKNLKAKIN